ncbi:MAG: anhydro-N-acetylmuramic acid kinase [Bryobacteraceae bacterium]
MRVAGMMSGTSLDGIDVAIVDIEGRRLQTIGFRSKPYSPALRRRLLGVSNAATTTAEISRLNFLLGEAYAASVIETCKKTRVPLDSVELIGCHGQTIYHESGVNTLQIGEADVIAERTGVPVVSGFRTRDIAAGGKGAPLVPFVDQLLFRDRHRTRVALNIGGIANLTAVFPDGRIAAFDTGPGNMVIDALTEEYTLGRQRFDRGGRIARRGRLQRDLLDNLMRDPYYRASPPKTAGREQYGAEFTARLKATGAPMEDLIATATVLTALTIALGVRQAAPAASEVIVSGGGVHNPGILAHLAALLPGVEVTRSSDYGIDPDAKEAIAFAVLAYRTWRSRPSNIPSATGARHPVILGKMSPASRTRL